MGLLRSFDMLLLVLQANYFEKISLILIFSLVNPNASGLIDLAHRLYNSLLLPYKLWSVMSFFQSVCKHSYGRNIDSIFMNFCTVIRGPKSKIEFVWNKNLITPFHILPHFLKFALWFMETLKRYNSVPVKGNCALCLPTPYFGSDNLMVLFIFTTYRPLLP